MKNILVAQSGGPTPVINSSLSGVLIDALRSDKVNKVYGAYYGVEGILEENLICFNDIPLDEIKYMKTTPSSALGSCRHKLSDYNDDKSEYDKIFEVFEKYDIGYFFYIGGNDSMDTVNKLHKIVLAKNLDIKVIGIPKTIDNDLFGIDHCPGFGSTSKYINTSIMEIYRDSICYDREMVTIVEVMGRNTGWIAASTCLATEQEGCPDLIYLPEVPFTLEKFKDDVEKIYKEKGKVFIVVSEGIKFPDGKYVGEKEAKTYDKFGHKSLGGACHILKEFVENNIEKRVKAIEFNILQRAATHQGSLIDIEEAFELGRYAFEYAMNGETGIMSTLVRNSNKPYNISYISVPVEKVANHEKFLPESFINENKTGITREGYEYFLPLIQGDYIIPKLNGLHRYTIIKPNYTPQ